MIELAPEDLKEVERVATEYTAAFRTANVPQALEMSVLPLVDCLDLGTRSGVYLMDETALTETVREHANEDFTTETTSMIIEPLGRHAALARIEAVVRKPDGREGQIEWVEFLARTGEGWKVWANWLGPLPEGF